MKKTRRSTKVIYVISLIGLLLSIYLLYLHYYPDADRFCKQIGGGCDIANKSIYSELDGVLNTFGIYINLPIPISALGILSFIFIIVMTKLIENGKNYSNILIYSTLFFILFSTYLTYAEFIVLDTFCVYCDIIKIIMLVILGILISLKYRKW